MVGKNSICKFENLKIARKNTSISCLNEISTYSKPQVKIVDKNLVNIS